MLKKFIAPIMVLCSSINAYAQNTSVDTKMEWFDDAKLGIFIHWGIYSVNGISESWAFFNNYINHPEYLKQLDGFSAQNYNPKYWASLIKNSGAKYTVITSKHHDGISLWDSQQEQALTTRRDAKVKQDVLTPFIAAVKDTGLKTGLYFSLPDWSHPYYDIITRTQKRYDIAQDTKRWGKFVDYYQGQLEELSQQFKPDLLWFDGDWEHSSQEWKAQESLALLRKYNPNIIINSRLNNHGDYATPEQGIPVKRPQDRYWELCYTMNDSWGYQHFDNNYKTPNMIVRTLVDCIAMGGNLLLDIGPKEDGTIPVEQVTILEELGRWTRKYKEAIYGTRAGVEAKYIAEKTAFSKDGKTIFIYLDVVKDHVQINGLKTKPKAIRFLSSKDKAIPKDDGSQLTIKLTNTDFDPAVSVLAIDFDSYPVFKLEESIKAPALQEVFASANTNKSIDYIVAANAAGDNILKGMIYEDGSQITGMLAAAQPNLKEWITKHAEALHDVQAGVDFNHYAGKSVLSPDRQTLYLFVDGQPTGPIALKGLKNKIARIRIVGEGSMISHQLFNKLYWSDTPGIVYIDVPKERLDKYQTVIAVLLDGPIDLFGEEVKAIENNL